MDRRNVLIAMVSLPLISPIAGALAQSAGAPRGAVNAAKPTLTTIGAAINKAGRQRMLSQRMAKAYFFRQAGVNAVQAGEMLDAAQQEFAKAHEELKAAPQNSGSIRAELALVEQQWFFFQNALSLRDAADRKKAMSDVATTSERILEQMDAVVALYEKAAG